MENFPDDILQFCAPKPLLLLQVLGCSLEFGFHGIMQARNHFYAFLKVYFLLFDDLCMPCRLF